MTYPSSKWGTPIMLFVNFLHIYNIPAHFFKIILRFVFNQNTNLRDMLTNAKLLLRNRNQRGNKNEVNIKITFQLLCDLFFKMPVYNVTVSYLSHLILTHSWHPNHQNIRDLPIF